MEKSHFISKVSWLAGFYMIQIFAGGIFEETIVLVSEAAIVKYLFAFYICGDFILVAL